MKRLELLCCNKYHKKPFLASLAQKLSLTRKVSVKRSHFVLGFHTVLYKTLILATFVYCSKATTMKF